MTDRDTFAAAALTGLIACMKDETVEDVCESAFGWADAMLRERGRTNHDAAPPQGAVSGDGSIPGSILNEPVAWVAWFDDEDRPDGDFVFSTKERADSWCRKRGAATVPLYLAPMLTDEEREAVHQAAIRVEALCQIGSQQRAATLRKLLERFK